MVEENRPRTLVPALALAALAPTCGAAPEARDELPAPAFGEALAERWRDGKAELAGYALTYPRYGELRSGTAVTIFVTEPFSERLRVKADPDHDGETFEVVKLNLVQEFPTGVYDYDLMTSVFVPTSARPGLPAGAATKVSFGAQEWCGQVYEQTLLDAGRARWTSHSYFDGEADRADEHERPAGGIAEDALWHWARGLAAPALAPGDQADVRVWRSHALARLRHLDPAWDPATLSVAAETTTVSVPAGELVARAHVAEVGGPHPRTWTFYVEEAPPRRIVRWTRDDGVDARLLGSERMKYWDENRPGDGALLERIGLEPR